MNTSPISEFKIRIGKRMPLVGEPVIVTAVSPSTQNITFVESYVFLPIPKEIIWQRLSVDIPEDVQRSDHFTPVDHGEFILDHARTDYEVFMSKKFPDVFRESFIRIQSWDDYLEDKAAVFRLRLNGLFEKEIKQIASTAKCRELREHFTSILQYQPIRINRLEGDIGC